MVELFSDINNSGKIQAPRLFAYLLLKKDYSYHIAKEFYKKDKQYASKLSALLKEMKEKGYVSVTFSRRKAYYRVDSGFVAKLLDIDSSSIKLILDAIRLLGPSNHAYSIIKNFGITKKNRQNKIIDNLTIITLLGDIILEFIDNYMYVRAADEFNEKAIWKKAYNENEPPFINEKLIHFKNNISNNKTYLNWNNVEKLVDTNLIINLDEAISEGDNIPAYNSDNETLDSVIKNSIERYFVREYRNRGLICNSLGPIH